MKLRIPASFKDASQKERDAASNGCGPQSEFFNAIPRGMRNFLFGLPIKCACDIHDWQYRHGRTEFDRNGADKDFYFNLKLIIKDRGGLLVRLRLVVAWLYYEAVSRWGGEAFKAKNAAD